ncbi:hypothetical protein HPB50_023217 [Hyalomma asiaticum]|uniref:Uncharacterized protein n=1 Tax=Hyalomma asiaticum TaxID=266040 RepID=A0ACB7SS98_HYAAI|nr:hypothetical protein HPB50_023217 [Hyalomma asiaticum]
MCTCHNDCTARWRARVVTHKSACPSSNYLHVEKRDALSTYSKLDVRPRENVALEEDKQALGARKRACGTRQRKELLTDGTPGPRTRQVCATARSPNASLRFERRSVLPSMKCVRARRKKRGRLTPWRCSLPRTLSAAATRFFSVVSLLLRAHMASVQRGERSGVGFTRDGSRS